MTTTETLNTWAVGWAAFMWGGLIDSTVLLVIVALFWLPLRRWVSPQVGYCLFLLILVKLLVPVHVPAPGWLAYLSPRHALQQLTAATPAPAARPGYDPDFLPRADFRHPELTPSTATGSPPAPFTAAAPGPSPAAAGPPLSAQAMLMLGWAFVVGALVLRFGWVQVRVQRLVRQAAAVDPASLPVDLEDLRRRAGVRRPVCLVASAALPVPAVWGLFRPRLLLPPDLLRQLTADQMTWVLLHELAHIRRADLVVALLQRVVQILYFFHPAVWLANWVVDQEREYACDDAALAACSASRHDCGAGFLCIVERANALPRTLAPALGLFDGFFTYKAFVRRRLMRILDSRRSLCPRLSAGAAALLLVVAAAVLPHLQADEPKAGSPPAAQDRAGPPAAPGRSPVVTEVKVPPEVLGVQFLFSPDGKKVVYITDWAMRELAVLDLTTNTTTKIVEATFVQDPVWSSKGDHVAFHNSSEEERSIRAVPAFGGPPRTIVSPAGFPHDWSKDGKWMVAWFSRRDRSGSLMLVPVDGGEPRQLLSLGVREWLKAKFSPDGQAVAYSREKDGQPGVFLFVLASQREVPVATGTQKNDQPTWSHDGRYLLFLRDRGDARDLVAQRIKDHAPAGEPVVLKRDMPGYSQSIDGSRFQVLDDGRLVYWTQTDVPVHLYAAALDPETGQVRGKPSVFASRIHFARPMLSPDGQWFAGLRNQTLWVSKVDGTEARKVPTEIHNPFEYGWFPDGKSVLTGGYADGGKGKRGLFRVDVATGKTETLYTSDQFISNARLSPDGQQIAFGMVGLNVMKAEPNAQPVLLRHGSANPAWSPDGRSIAFIDRPRQAESNRLLVIPAAGGEPKELVGPTPGSLTFPLWSPNGKFIVYSRVADARPDSPPEIWLVSTAGGPPVHLREFDGYLPQTDSCLWSADGKALLFKGRAERPKVSVWSMTNYLPAD